MRSASGRSRCDASLVRRASRTRRASCASPFPLRSASTSCAKRSALGEHGVDPLRGLDELVGVGIGGVDRRIPVRQVLRLDQGLEGLLELVHRRVHGLHTQNLDDSRARPRRPIRPSTGARPRAQGVHRAPRCTNGSPARQRSRKRPMGGCNGSSASSRRRTTRTSRTAGSLDGRSSGRIGERNRVDDVHDVAARAVARGRYRFREGHRLSGRQSPQSAFLRQLAPQRVLHRLPRLDPAARQQPVGASRLLVPHEHERVTAVQERADAQSRRLVLHARPLDPKP